MTALTYNDIAKLTNIHIWQSDLIIYIYSGSLTASIFSNTYHKQIFINMKIWIYFNRNIIMSFQEK